MAIQAKDAETLEPEVPTEPTNVEPESTVSNADRLRESLNVQPPDSLVSWINMLIYSDPGVGKTFFCGTADDSELTSPVLILDVEGGLTTIRHRATVDTISVRSRKILEDTYDRLLKSIDVDGQMYYKTVCIDSLTELAALDMKVIMQEAYEKNPDKVDKDVPSQREWGKSREHVRSIVRGFRDLPCNVIYTAHVGVLQEEGQPNKYFPGFAGKLRTEVPGFMDIVGYLYAENNGGEVTRTLQVQATRRVVAKDRTSRLGGAVENPTIPMLWELIHTP